MAMTLLFSMNDRAAALDFGKPFPSLMLPEADFLISKDNSFHSLHMWVAEVVEERSIWGSRDWIKIQNAEILQIIKAIAPAIFDRMK